jgi:hypothetical protein
MTRKHCFSFLLLVLIPALYGCRQTQKQAGEASDTLAMRLDQNLRAIDSTWNRMMVSDDTKIANMRRLCKELELLKGSQEAEIKALLEQVEQLPHARYTREQVALSGFIEKYDSLTNAAIENITATARKLAPEQEYQLINQLISEIRMADDSVLFYRKEYDHTLDLYSAFLKEKGAGLRKRFPGIDSLRRYRVFRAIP